MTSSHARFRQFDQYKLITKFGDGYYEHNSVPEASSTIPGQQRAQKSVRWVREKVLGRGRFGTVWLERGEAGVLRAVKQIDKMDMCNNEEILALVKLKMHPQHFVQFFGWFESEESIYLAMEYVKYGDLNGLILKDYMTERDARTITTQVLEGLKTMHENGFCHRDLKPQNILVASLSPIVVKISDFGVSKQVDGTALRTIVGTLSYIAPEIMGYISSENSSYTNAVDIWSLGCLVHAIITKETPFTDTRKLLSYIEGLTPFPEAKLVENGISSAAIKFITSLMAVRPQDRLTANQALGDPWLAVEIEQEDTIWTKITDEAIILEAGSGLGIIIPGDVEGQPLHNCPTPYCAVRHGNTSVLRRQFEENRVDINAKQRGGITLLHMIVDSGNEDMMRLFLEKGVDTTVRDENEKTPLRLVIEKGNQAMVKLLLESGTSTEEKDRFGKTALHHVLDHAPSNEHKYNEGVVKMLLEYGADAKAKDAQENTALHKAALDGYETIVKLLFEFGATITKNNSGCTALHMAASSGHTKVAKLLLENGADIMAKNNFGCTALHQATDSDSDIARKEIIELLLGSGVDIMAKDELKMTALDKAVRKGNEGIVRILLENGAEITKLDDGIGFNALHVAAQMQHEGIAKLLVENGPKAYHMVENEKGETALDIAAQLGHESVVKVLLENVPEIVTKATAPSRPMALHLAVKNGHERVAKLLLESGANVMAKDGDGSTALHLAVKNGNKRMVELLIQNGADVGAKNSKGQKPLRIANEKGYRDIQMMLGKESGVSDVHIFVLCALGLGLFFGDSHGVELTIGVFGSIFGICIFRYFFVESKVWFLGILGLGLVFGNVYGADLAVGLIAVMIYGIWVLQHFFFGQLTK